MRSLKKISVFLILMMISTVCMGQTVWPISSRNVANPSRLRRLLQSRFDNVEGDVASLLALKSKGTGSFRYVDSGRSNAATIDGLSWIKAEPTIEAAFAQSTNGLTANSGDVVFVAQGHTEDPDGADGIDCDVAGVTVWGLGDGVDMPEVTYTATSDEFVFGAANITVYNIRFVAGVSAITMGISVEAAGDNAMLIGCVFPEPTTATFEFIDAIDLADAANGFKCYYNIYRHASTTGPTHFIDAGNGTNYDMEIVGNDIIGEFSVAAIWSDTVDLRGMVKHNDIINMTSAQHCIEFTAAATGHIIGNNCYGDTEGSIIDPGSMYQAGNNKSVAINAPAIPGWVITNGLNHLTALDGTGAYPETAANDSIIAKLFAQSNGGIATLSDYDNDTMSLEAIAADATNSGTYLVVTASVVSSAIPSATQTGGAITGAASGTLLLIDIYCNTDATALVAPTSLEFSVDNVYGNTGAGDVIATEATAGLGASLSWRLTTDATSHTLPVFIESGKKVFIHGDDSAGTGAGILQFTLVFQRVTDAATIAGNDGPS